jgi:hypothetical protein
MFNANVENNLYCYGLSLLFKANYNNKILGKYLYLNFKANFHGYSSIYWFKINLT